MFKDDLNISIEKVVIKGGYDIPPKKKKKKKSSDIDEQSKIPTSLDDIDGLEYIEET